MDKPIILVKYLSTALTLESVVSTFECVCGEMKSCRLFRVPGQPANSALIEFNTKESAVIAISLLNYCYLEGNEISISAVTSDVLPENAASIGNYEKKSNNSTNMPVTNKPLEPLATPEPEVQQNREEFIDDLWKSYSLLLHSDSSDASIGEEERRKVLDNILVDLAQGSSAQTTAGSSKSSSSTHTDGSNTMYMSIMDGNSADDATKDTIQRTETLGQFIHSMRDAQLRMEASIVPTGSPELSLNDGDWWNWVVGQQPWSFNGLLDKVISSGELNEWSKLISTRLKARFHQQLNGEQVKELERVIVVIESSLQQMLQQIVVESGANQNTNKDSSQLHDITWAWAVFDILVNRAFREEPKLKDDILSGKIQLLPVLSSLVTLTRMNIGYHHLLLEKKVIASELKMTEPPLDLDLTTDIEDARKVIEKVLIKAYFDKRIAPESMTDLGAQIAQLNKLAWFNVQLFMFKASFKIQHEQMKFEVFVNDVTAEANWKQLNADINKIQSKKTSTGCIVM